MTVGTSPCSAPLRSIDRSAADAAPSGLLPVALTPIRPARSNALLGVLAVAVVLASLISAGRGQLMISPGEVLGSIWHRLGLDWGSLPAHPNGDAALWNIRLPRVAMGLLVGAALGTAGALMQGVFGNPLAEPGVIGISSGAGVGACAVIVFGWNVFGPFTIAAAAFVTALVTTVAVYGLARSGGRTEVVTLVLMGIAVNAACSGLIAYLVFSGDTAAREQIVFWQLGSLNGSRWSAVRVVAPLVGTGLVWAGWLSRKLDLLALGERPARHLGLNVERFRLSAIVAVTLLVASGVAFAGIIGFVGLVVPHLIRMVIGPSHRMLVPASALGGALVLTVADLVARTAVDYADLPIGMLTAVVGGPFFFWLILRTRRAAGGWA